MMEPEPTLPFGDAEDTVAWLLDRAQMFDPYIHRPVFEQLARWIEHAAADTLRMDWLADPANTIGNVQLPTQCVTDNVHSLRAAIDDAMKLPAPSNAGNQR